MRNVKAVKVGDCVLDGRHIYIQSMLNARSDDIEGSVKQAVELEKAGCEIIRAAIPDMEAVKLIPAIKEAVNIPLVADIHFDYRLAVESAAAGVDKIRINPGNIGGMDRVKQVVDACRTRNLPIRIGVNSGSLEKDIITKYGGVTAEGLAESAYNAVKYAQSFGFYDIAVSLKSSDVQMNHKAHKLIADRIDNPLHIGLTEAGVGEMAEIKSCSALGALLLDGIGDTIRISLTGDPVREVLLAKKLLKAIGIRKGGIDFVSCPTCGRTKVDLPKIAAEIEKELISVSKKLEAENRCLRVAVMGCAVNGPGEAKSADIGANVLQF